MGIKELAGKLPQGIGQRISIAGLMGKKHSPAILFAGGVIGVVATVVLASRSTLKLSDILEDAQDKLSKADEALSLQRDDYDENDHKKDVAIVYINATMRIVKLYSPALAVGLVSICALTGSHVILSRRNFALTAAYAAVEKSYKQYRERVVADLGPEKDMQYRYDLVEKEIVEDTEDGPVKKTILAPRDKVTGASMYARFFDETTSKSWSNQPFANQYFLRTNQDWMNDRLQARGYLFLNEVYEQLGLATCPEGQLVGWIWDPHGSECGDNAVDLGVFSANRDWIAMQFVNGQENSILLDPNVDGVIYDKIGKTR